MGLVLRVMPDRLLVNDPRDFTEEEEDEVIRARMLPEIEEWCQATFGRIPSVNWHDGSDYDQRSDWLIWFFSEAEAIAFKMRWFDHNRD